MGTVSRSPYYRSTQTEPLSTVLIDTPYEVEKISVMADEASIVAGHICYISANTYPNEVTMADAVHGSLVTEGRILIIEIEACDIHHPTNYDKTTAGVDLQPMTAYVLKPGMKVWCKGSSLTCAIDEDLFLGANGVLTNSADPDGEAVDTRAHTFTALTALSSGSWVPVEYRGVTSFDNSA